MNDDNQNPTDAQQGQTSDDTNATTTGTNPLDPTAFDALKQELEQTQGKLKEMTNITQHALADLQNFRRRAEEERASYIIYANADLMKQLLPVLENMNKAIVHEPKDAEWIKAAETTMKQFQQTLEKMNLKPIAAKGKPFDPKIHEALMTGPGPKDQVMEEYETGYMLGDKVIKPTRVLVGNGETPANEPAAA